MTIPGTKPKPSAVKKLGPKPHHKQNKKEPQPTHRAQSPPYYLDGKAKYLFKQLVEILHTQMRVLTDADRLMLTALCEAYGEWRQAKAVLQDKNLTYETKTASGDVMIRPRPEVQIKKDAAARMLKISVEFGLTPSSRTRLEAKGAGDEVDPFEEFLKGGGKPKVVK